MGKGHTEQTRSFPHRKIVNFVIFLTLRSTQEMKKVQMSFCLT